MTLNRDIKPALVSASSPLPTGSLSFTLLRAGEGGAGSCKQAGMVTGTECRLGCKGREAKQSKAKQGAGRQPSIATGVTGVPVPQVLVRLLPWEPVLEARMMFIYKGIFQSPFPALATSLCCFFMVFPLVSSQCATASDRSWHPLQPSTLQSLGASCSPATR